ncbi:acyl-CoA-binding domain-containing protein 4-like [Phragmites australis]|uniref:acyl-CoA-binding domain-containing protein 4-like n=1 Tax=Phragmites australis TaxID=29695 RepID=UPI002D79F5E9|nr:acyl-CoA-binding domain-containing protein 4-like [Phragmites australis]XP_062203142.1 acyl-CoA-binding domain-containing protein 4-like [Phragmites australis]
MFGFSRRRVKLGRLKDHSSDPLNGSRSPARLAKHLSLPNGDDVVTTSVSGRADDLSYRCSSDTFDLDGRVFSISDNWAVLSTEGDKPIPRFYHAAAIVGSKMVVFGGDSGHHLLDDTKILNLEKLTWDSAVPKVRPSPSGRTTKLPACKGHCLVPWGNSVILLGGKTEPASDRLSVWTFNVETEIWSLVEAKGDIPAARSGHTIIRAGATLILFGGEDTKGKKRHDLHMFDLKSSTWLPLNYKGAGPSPRSNHVATLYDDRILLIFGGHSKSKTLNDLYSLDFETMVWSRVKTHGPHPSPRAGCSGALCGTKWYIAGGASKKKRHAETWVFDVLQSKWSVCVVPPSSSITTKKGFSMVPFYHRDKIALVAFGGNKKEPCNKVEVLVVLQNEHSFSWRSAPDSDRVLYEYSPSNKELADHLNKCSPLYSNSSVARHSLTSVIENPARREALSESSLKHPNLGTSVHGQLHQVQKFSLAQKPIDDDRYDDADDSSSCQESTPKEHRGKRMGTDIHQIDMAGILARKAENPVTGGSSARRIARCSSDVSQSHLYSTKIADLVRRNAALEEQLETALASKDQLEKNLSWVIRSREELEKRLAGKDKEAEMLKEKIAGLESAQEESNNLSNTVHTDNVRLEREVAFLKAVTDETHKELHSTRRVLAGEQSRAFQLQVEVFHLKQRLQILEGRSGTPTKQP